MMMMMRRAPSGAPPIYSQAAVRLASFGRLVVVKHRLFTQGRIKVNLSWRRARKGKLGTYKLPWYRGHRGFVITSGRALRLIGLAAFCRQIAVRRRLYVSECAAIAIQSVVRAHRQRLVFMDQRNRWTKLQAAAKARRASAQYHKFQGGVTEFQALYRSRKSRSAFRGCMRAVCRIQASHRRAVARIRLKKSRSAATLIQTWCVRAYHASPSPPLRSCC